MKAIDRANSYLAIKPRTAKEVSDYLRGKGYEDDEITAAIEQLKEYRFIDDGSYARMYIQFGFEKGRGRSRIEQELRAEGVDTFIIEDAFYELEEEGVLPDQEEIALQVVRNVFEGVNLDSLDYKEKKKLEAKAARRLASRGFSTEIAYRVIKKLEM